MSDETKEPELHTIMFILCRKDINMSQVKLAQQVAIASLHCSHKGMTSCLDRLGQWSNRCEWYRNWVSKKLPIYVLGCDNVQDLWNAHHAILDRAQDIPIYIVKDQGYCQGEPETITCMGIGPCDKDIIKDIVMKYQMY